MRRNPGSPMEMRTGPCQWFVSSRSRRPETAYTLGPSNTCGPPGSKFPLTTTCYMVPVAEESKISDWPMMHRTRGDRGL